MNINTEKLIKSRYMGAKISPSKVVSVSRAIRGKKIDDALAFLHFNTKKASGIIYGVVRSAIANGVSSSGVSRDNLYVKDIRIGPGPTKKWRRFFAKGRTGPILRRTTNITAVLGVLNAENSNSDQGESK